MHPLVSHTNNKDSFTLVELLVVIGILAILTAAVLIIINPAEYLKSSRDATRMSDLSSINRALSVLETQGITSFGTANRVYISIADDASSTCGSLSLPTLPTNWLYQCVSTSNLQKTDGTGWIPVNFSSAPSLSFSNLPIDPVNSTSSYYSYYTGGSFELNAILESSKYRLSGDKDRTSTDGGDSFAVYEVGSSKSLSPFKDTGLIGYWTFEEGSGSTTNDISKNGHTGTLYGTTSMWENSGKLGKALKFNGSSNYVDIATTSSILPNAFTVVGWIKYNSGTRAPMADFGALYPGLYYKYDGGTPLIFLNASVSYKYFQKSDYDLSWHHVAFIVPGNQVGDISQALMYQDGISIPIGSGTDSGAQASKIAFRLGRGGSTYLNGYLDDLRIYDRVLSMSEIKSIYDATK